MTVVRSHVKDASSWRVGVETCSSQHLTGDFAPRSAKSRGSSMRPCLTYVSAIAMAGGAARTTPGLASPAPPTVTAILAANHTAVGQVPANGGAEFDYSYSGSGLTGTRTDSVGL